MAIQKLSEFAEIGDKNLTGIDMQQGFIQAEKPARQWFNSLFNSTIKKVNEVITAIEAISIGTDKIADGAVTTAKLANAAVTGDKIAKNAALNTPLLPNTYALTTLAAPNLTMDATGALTRSSDPLNASSRKVGKLSGNVPEYDAQNGLQTAHIQAGATDAPKLMYKIFRDTWQPSKLIPHGLNMEKVVAVSFTVKVFGTSYQTNPSSAGISIEQNDLRLLSGGSNLDGFTVRILVTYEP